MFYGDELGDVDAEILQQAPEARGEVSRGVLLPEHDLQVLSALLALTTLRHLSALVIERQVSVVVNQHAVRYKEENTCFGSNSGFELIIVRLKCVRNAPLTFPMKTVKAPVPSSTGAIIASEMSRQIPFLRTE